MSTPLNTSPPKWPLAFLRWFLKAEYLEEIEGDMEEIFQDLLKEQSVTQARRKYALEVLQLLRPNLIKHIRIAHPLNNKDMIRHNFLLIVRNFLRYKSTFLINLIGLTTGLTCTLLAILWIQDEFQIDRFHEKDDRIYQVLQNIQNNNGKSTITSTPARLAEALVTEHPEVEKAVQVIPPRWIYESGILRNKEVAVRVSEQYVGEQFFDVFSFPLLHGNRQEILKTKDEILISVSTAQKLFGTTEGLIGNTLQWEHDDHSGQYTITGIFKDPPKNSSLQFEALFHFELFMESFDFLEKWHNSEPNTYALLTAGTNPETYQKKLSNFIATKVDDYENTLLLQQFSKRYLYGNYKNGQIAGGRITYIHLFSIIGLFILLIACINFMNLSTAQASRRLKEIGVKKAIGAGRRTLIGQYLGESLLLASIALVVAIGLTLYLLPGFNNLVEKQLVFSTIAQYLGILLGITFLTGLIAGIYPALYLSRFQPVNVLKGILGDGTGRGQGRRVLVVFQFCISMVLIIASLVVYQQTRLIQSKNLGYDRENILYFNNDGPLLNNSEAFKKELAKLPGVLGVSGFDHDLTGNHGGTTGVNWQGKDPEIRIGFSNLEIGHQFIETIGIKMVEGRSYSMDYLTDKNKIIFNEAAIDAMGMEDPIGKNIQLWGKKREIIGIAQNFHFEDLYHKVEPCFLLLLESTNKTMVKLAAGNQTETTIAAIKDVYHQFSEGLPFVYQFLDDDYQSMYRSEQQMGVLSRYFCAIAIIISCLGLFGLMAFSVERRKKEMGIRKILGAGPLRIIYHLSNDATRMVLLAVLLAMPFSYWLSSKWLANFAYSIQLSWWLFLGAGLTTLLIAWVTVGVQSIKATRVNPAETLRQG